MPVRSKRQDQDLPCSRQQLCEVVYTVPNPRDISLNNLYTAETLVSYQSTHDVTTQRIPAGIDKCKGTRSAGDIKGGIAAERSEGTLEVAEHRVRLAVDAPERRWGNG